MEGVHPGGSCAPWILSPLPAQVHPQKPLWTSASQRAAVGLRRPVRNQAAYKEVSEPFLYLPLPGHLVLGWPLTFSTFFGLTQGNIGLKITELTNTRSDVGQVLSDGWTFWCARSACLSCYIGKISDLLILRMETINLEVCGWPLMFWIFAPSSCLRSPGGMWLTWIVETANASLVRFQNPSKSKIH